jgi:exopolyphosphatase/guanosine-5'-triphosphate,3'-diphosphate pyrophosphatase
MMTTHDTRYVAAIDLGSNSFHMVVAQVADHGLQLISRHKQRVRLASGLDQNKRLDSDAIERGLDCLAMFAERIQGFAPENVRIAATYTLRRATNASKFIERAKAVIPYPIEIIPGIEEGRLIYLGVVHTQPQSESMLVIDIGGGSSEMVIGHGFEPTLINSLQMGCVSYTNRFFNQGKLSRKRFNQAYLTAEQRIESVVHQYRAIGWQTAFGSSGTIKAIREVLIGIGFDDGVITRERLETLIEKLCEKERVEDLDLKGLNDDRKPVFAAGLAILYAIVKDLKIKQMHFSDGALREGLLYEMEDQLKYADIRLRTTEDLAQKHRVDLEHAAKVRDLAKCLFEQVSPILDILPQDKELIELLEWGALLHEVGLSICLQGFHRHSEYILRHTNMPGFNSEQQLVIATLARFQRKALKLNEMPDFTLYKKKHVTQLIRLLRLAVVLSGQRNNDPYPDVVLQINEDQWMLTNREDKNWLDNNKLLLADLTTEQQFWQTIGWSLHFT